MNDLPELVTYKIWKYYWQNKKQNYLQDIKNKKHKLLYKYNNIVEYVYLDVSERLLFNHPITEILYLNTFN